MFRNYFATELSMTERGIRQMIESNPRRYEQLLVGSLILNEINFKDFLEKVCSGNVKLFLSDKDKKSIEAINMMEEMLGEFTQKETQYHEWKHRVIKILNSTFSNQKGKNNLIIHESSIENHGSSIDDKVSTVEDCFTIIVSISSSMTENINYEHSAVINIKDKTLEEIYKSVAKELRAWERF
jgi:hypothetical protein